MPLLTREQILAGKPTRMEKVTAYGGEVYVRVLRGWELDSFEQDMLAKRNGRVRNIRAAFVARCLCDADGNRILGDEDVEALGETDAGELDRLWDVASRLNRRRPQDVEELAKNSGNGQT